MRTRTKTIPGHEGGNYVVRVTNNEDIEVDEYSAYVPPEPPSSISQMWDVEDSSEAIFNDCFHYRVNTSVVGYQLDWTSTVPYVIYGKEIGSRVEYTQLPVNTILPYALSMRPLLAGSSFPKNLLDSWDDDLELWGMQEMKEVKLSLCEGFSLPNFLFEWTQVMQLTKSWISRSEISDRWHKVAGTNKPLFERATNVARERLAHSYGTRPFISDVRALHKVLTTWKQRADRFLADAGQIKKFYRGPLSKDGGWQRFHCGTLPVFGAELSTLWLEERITQKYNGTLAYSYHCAEVKGCLARLAQLSDSLGVRLDAGIVWDAIPFSFVVDWFVNVSEFLHNNYSKDWFSMDVVMEDYCFSNKVDIYRKLRWSRFVDRYAGQYLPSEDSILEQHSTYYRRSVATVPKIAPKSIYFTPTEFNVARILNAGALSTVQLSKFLKLSKKLKGRYANGHRCIRWVRHQYRSILRLFYRVDKVLRRWERKRWV